MDARLQSSTFKALPLGLHSIECIFLTPGHPREPSRHANTTKALRRDAKGIVELAGHVLKGNQASQFNDGVIVEVAAEVCKYALGIVGSSHRFCVAQGSALSIIETAALFAAVRWLNDLER